jgi:hypothetical protein
MRALDETTAHVASMIAIMKSRRGVAHRCRSRAKRAGASARAFGLAATRGRTAQEMVCRAEVLGGDGFWAPVMQIRDFP